MDRSQNPFNRKAGEVGKDSIKKLMLGISVRAFGNTILFPVFPIFLFKMDRARSRLNRKAGKNEKGSIHQAGWLM